MQPCQFQLETSRGIRLSVKPVSNCSSPLLPGDAYQFVAWSMTKLSHALETEFGHVQISCLAGGRPYIQCSIPVLSKESEEVTVVHCSHSADAITNYLSNALDLKGKLAQSVDLGSHAQL